MASDGGRILDPDDYFAAVRSAAQRIIPARKRMTLDDAEDIVRVEFERRGQPVSSDAVTDYARTFHRGPWWELLHPLQARREGIRFSWPWRDVMDQVPAAVENLANHEAWRCTGHGTGQLSAGLEPAVCQRVSKNRYSCVAEVLDEREQPVCRVEIQIACRSGKSPTVIDAVVQKL